MATGRDEFVGAEWDKEKSARCYEQRGFDFEYAAEVFDSDFIEWEDRRRDWGEPRFIAVGELDGRILALVWTPRTDRRRIISARPASHQEREKLNDYRKAQQQANP